MKKFFFYVSVILFVLGFAFAVVLYSEGAFDGHVKSSKSDMTMKCEAGKCGGSSK
jgi:hypothetical protein